VRAEAKPYRPDLFEHFGTVHIRRMFGGRGLFSGEVMIGLVSADDLIFLKTDERTRQAYVEEGSKPYLFHLKRARGAIATSYYELPERLYDEPEEFAEWVRLRHRRTIARGAAETDSHETRGLALSCRLSAMLAIPAPNRQTGNQPAM
jgi:DNA transformation protein